MAVLSSIVAEGNFPLNVVVANPALRGHRTRFGNGRSGSQRARVACTVLRRSPLARSLTSWFRPIDTDNDQMFSPNPIRL